MQRIPFFTQIDQAFRTHPIVALLGPRQCGKTTLARQYIENDAHFPKSNYFDLEDLGDLARLEQPKLALSSLEGLIVIDEIQRIPDLFPTLRVLVDKPDHKQRYLILGSASRELIQQSSESLAGRIQYIELPPFTYSEVDNTEMLWLRGGFPKSYLAKNNADSYAWREAYIQTFLEHDIAGLGFRIPAPQLRRFWMMLTHYHGQISNHSEIGRSLQVTSKTTQHYNDILTSTFMVRQLQPWFENISKRQVKTPKIYFRDSGLYHSLLGIHDKDELLVSAKLGASWEGFALEEIIRKHQARPQECFFWSTQGIAELDLLIMKDGKKLGFEFKYTDKPTLTKSMRIASEDLGLDQLTVIYPGELTFPLGENMEVSNLKDYLQG